MENEKVEQFENVDVLKFVKQGLANGSLTPQKAEKIARIYARDGIVGEEIRTIMADGLEETVNVVKEDPETHKVDKVVTNPGKEQYIVPASKFEQKYEVDPENPEMYKPKGGPVTVTQIDQNIAFKASWGEDMQIKSGGYLVITSYTDIYGIQEKEFNETYRIVSDTKSKKI